MNNIIHIIRHSARAATVLLLALLTATTAWAQPSGNWNDWVNDNNIDWDSAEAKAAAIPQSDDGSTVYISTAEQLAYYAYAVNNDKMISGSASGYYCGRTVELLADIDLSAHYWKPIGWNKYYYFNGYFHGNGHVITGIHVNGNPQSDNPQQNFPCYGLFGYLHTRSGGTSTITDLVLKDFSITASFSGDRYNEFYLGGLVGRCDDNTAITNCLLVNGSVSKDVQNNYAHIGKVAGGGSPSTATANYYHNVSVSGWGSVNHYAQQTIGGETEARAVALTISSTHGSVALGGTVGRISDGIIYAPANETVTLNTTTDAGYIASLAATGLTLTSGQFTMPDNDDGTIAATVSIDPAQFSQDGDTYTIHTAGGWNVFCDLLAENDKGYFDGKTVKLGADITVTRMAGGEYHDFTGTFDGDGHTLTFSHTATDNYCAPFRHVQGATAETPAVIHNLNVVSTVTAADYRHPAGLIALQSGYVSVTDCNVEAHINCTKGAANPSDLYPAALVSQSNNSGVLTVSGCSTTGQIATDGKYAAGLIGIVQNTATIENCRVSVTIQSSTSGDGTHGGLVASQSSKNPITITGCVFDGRLLGSTTNKCGGFIGWRNYTATITNSLFAPAEVTVQNEGSATFARNGVDTYNCYYTTLLNDGTNYAPAYVGGTETPNLWHNGKAITTHTVAAGTDVTIGAVALTGDATQYTVSGITAYSGGGLQRGQTLYYGSGDQLSLTLSNTATGAPQGYRYDGYTASAGTLSGTTLTMPDEDVTISVNTAAIRSDGLQHEVNYMTADGTTQTAQAIALDGHETRTSEYGSQYVDLAAGWYYVGTDIDYTGIKLRPQGNITLILADGCTMHIGTAENRTGVTGIERGICDLTIYGQSLDAATAGTISYEGTGSNGFYVRNYTQQSGNVSISNSTFTGGSGLNAESVTLNGGKLSVATNSKNAIAIEASNGDITINGGQLDATATGSGNIYGLYAKGTNRNITLGWTNLADRIFASSYSASGTVKVADGQALADGSGNIYSGTLSADQISAIAGQELVPVLMGDVNGDGTLTIADVMALVDIVLGKGTNVVKADVTLDGQVSIADVTALVNIIRGME